MSRHAQWAVLGLLMPLASATGAERQPRPPALAPALIDGLRACPDGGFALPGSRTCMRLSGTIEAETTLGTPQAKAYRHGLSVREQARGRFSLDVRTPTELGPLRVYTSVRVDAAPQPDVLRR